MRSSSPFLVAPSKMDFAAAKSSAFLKELLNFSSENTHAEFCSVNSWRKARLQLLWQYISAAISLSGVWRSANLT